MATKQHCMTLRRSVTNLPATLSQLKFKLGGAISSLQNSFVQRSLHYGVTSVKMINCTKASSE